MGQHVTPGDNEQEQNDSEEAVVPRLPRSRVELVGGPEREADSQDPYGFPHKLEQEQRQHLEWIAKSHSCQERDGRQQAPDNSTHMLQVSREIKYPRPDTR